MAKNRDIIIGIDYTGKEESFVFPEIGDLQGLCPILHNGESEKEGLDNTLKNLSLLRKKKSEIKRVGHGLFFMIQRSKQQTPRDVIFEFCPFTYLF